jgi:hypothetical protein
MSSPKCSPAFATAQNLTAVAPEILRVNYFIDLHSGLARLCDSKPRICAVAQDTFAAAVDDSHLLLAFLGQRSLTMDQRSRKLFWRHADAITRVQGQVATEQAVSEHDRTAFWESFHLLSHLASPITIEGIRSYLNQHYRSGQCSGAKIPGGLQDGQTAPAQRQAGLRSR